MDKKERQLFDYYYNKFAERRFDEKDVLSFLLFVKNDLQDNKVIKELGDFIVHRENNSGYVKEFFVDCKEVINNLGKGKPKKIETMFSFKEIRNGFNNLFIEQGLEKLSHDVINDFILCIISLLQNVKLVSGNLQKEVGHLSFAASSKELFLMGNMKVLHKGRFIPVTFPVLSVKNIYEKVKPQDEKDTPYLFDDQIIEVINSDGEMMITFPTL
ncbi:hypothetical protein [Sporosarcina highlanderae]|uniref:Uncharacterized protein n=1 Tax=Sporosarcina highlanderae TaxID=3035916 RepID=A0ABT8JUF4_9BACL|nr:hypothetical protein [Sporosarcina highlanderae]MDN4608799.1 hypothetical protein [Sporosarcina highlanderae]